MFLSKQDFDLPKSKQNLPNQNLLESVAVSPAPTALIESIIQINEDYKSAFYFNENAVKAKAFRAPPRTTLCT